MELREITDRVFNNFREAMADMPKDSHIPPVALIFQGDKMGLIPTEPFASTGPAWRSVLAQVIQGINQQMGGVEAFCIGIHTWGLLKPGQDILAKLESGDLKTPDEIPDKDLLLIIIAGDNFQTIVRMWKVTKDPETGHATAFEEQDDLSPEGSVEMSGPFYDILVERPKHLN